MILVIDNYDSFTYNLVHYLVELGAEVDVRRNDALSVDEALALRPNAVLLSPGPCTPDEAGICLDLIRAAAVVPVKRRPTKPTYGSQLRRLEEKGRRSQIKRGRTSLDD
eukprot:gene15663-18441_t